jgi:hypothetical protein
VRVSAELDRETADLQRDALLAVNIDARHLFEDHASGAKYDRLGLVTALAYMRPSDDTATPAIGQKQTYRMPSFSLQCKCFLAEVCAG